MDERSRSDANARLKRIAGQVGGLQRMLAEDRYCVDVLLQVAAVRAALAEVSRVVLAHHLEACLTQAIQTAGKADRRVQIGELLDVFSRYSALGTQARTLRRKS